MLVGIFRLVVFAAGKVCQRCFFAFLVDVVAFSYFWLGLEKVFLFLVFVFFSFFFPPLLRLGGPFFDHGRVELPPQVWVWVGGSSGRLHP